MVSCFLQVLFGAGGGVVTRSKVAAPRETLGRWPFKPSGTAQVINILTGLLDGWRSRCSCKKRQQYQPDFRNAYPALFPMACSVVGLHHTKSKCTCTPLCVICSSQNVAVCDPQRRRPVRTFDVIHLRHPARCPQVSCAVLHHSSTRLALSQRHWLPCHALC